MQRSSIDTISSSGSDVSEGLEGNGAHEELPLLKRNVQDISLEEPLRRLWLGRRTLLRTIAIFMAGAVIFLMGSRSEYTARTAMMPEKQSDATPSIAGLDILQQFGGLAGISADGFLRQPQSLPVQIYPDILHSTPVLLHLIEQPIRRDGEIAPLERHLTDLEPFALWDWTGDQLSAMIASIRNVGAPDRAAGTQLDSTVLYVSASRIRVADELKDRLHADIDKKSGVLQVSATMPEPEVAAQVARYAVQELTAYITRYRIQKLEEDLKFIQTRHDESKGRADAAMDALASFRDKNQNLARALARTEEQRLQAQYDLSFNVYSILATKLEEAKLKVQEETPVFQVLEPVTVPIKKSHPKTVLILFLALLLGTVFGSTVVLSRFNVDRIRRTFSTA